MRLSLRLMAERGGRGDALGRYLDDPLRLFIPVRCSCWRSCTGWPARSSRASATARRGVGPPSSSRSSPSWWSASTCVPLLIVRAIRAGARRAAAVVRRRCARLLRRSPRIAARLAIAAAAPRAAGRRPTGAGERRVRDADGARPRRGAISRRKARELLQSIVDFTRNDGPRGDDAAPRHRGHRADATLGDLRALFREEQYSRMPVYHDNLDNIVGIVFVKDLIVARPPGASRHDAADAAGALRARDQARVRAAEGVPAPQVQMAIVVDEYGGTAGLVTSRTCSRRSSARSATIRRRSRARSSTRATALRLQRQGHVDEVARSAGRRHRGRRLRDRRRLPAVAPRRGAAGRRDVRDRRARGRGARGRAPPHHQGARARRREVDAAGRACRRHEVRLRRLLGRPNAGKSTLLNRLVGRSSRSSPTSRRRRAPASSA